MNYKRITTVFGAVLALSFVLQATSASAQVTITYGTPYNYSNQYQSYGDPTYSVPSNRVYNAVPSNRYRVVTRYQVSPQYGVRTGRYSSGYRGNTVPFQSYSPYQGTYYGNQVYSNRYYQPYGNVGQYYGTPSQQRGAVIGGAIGNAVGGQRAGNLGAAIGAAVGGR